MKVGVIGLGIMGAPMVRRLRERGFETRVWNLEPERFAQVSDAGALWCDSPAGVRAASDIVVLCVLDGRAVEDVCFGAQGLAGAGGAEIVVDCSTVPPEATRDIAGRMDAAWIDAPVSGGPQLAETGELTMLLGGQERDIERARAVIDALAANATHLGPLGAGQAAKTLNQAIVGVNYVLMAELLALARKSGIDPARLPQALAGGMADSQILQRIYPQMEQRDFDDPKAYARQLRKDLDAVAQFVEGRGVDAVTIRAAVERYGAYVDAGHEMSDSAAIAQFYDGDDTTS
ncbi:oxidoreductase [Oceanicola granulosus HTCC2516]|uniref:Oxidoreductase n=1 Tax=Oceanicola granulosus (strain ATCC BAA-861 / DSM 15982 / KCTC 12143 / HTCC2516) TaxID=314256 RepID=Q2CHC8_OCEGH|nr:NAD(P)-dependent oxidoreductase [Oceanicola granulosus]EAR52111.1 oxidoreductase [Oceanicola granulosus HTCC2516]